MSLDAMKKVLDAEQSARQSYMEASAASKQLIADAEIAGKQRLADAQAEADSVVKGMLLDAEATAAKNADEIMHHAENQCAVLRAHAESKLCEAVNRIVERIVID